MIVALLLGVLIGLAFAIWRRWPDIQALRQEGVELRELEQFVNVIRGGYKNR